MNRSLLKEHWPVVVIITAAAALRITLLFFRGTMWFDELFTIRFSSIPSWAETWRYWTLETNPPLFLFLMRWYLRLGNPNMAWFARLPAVFFGLSAIILLYKFGIKLFSKKTAIIASAFLALSGIHILASTETRSYTMFGLLTILSFYLFYELFYEKKQTRRRIIAYIAVTTALLYTHLTAVMIPVIQGLTLVLWRASAIDWKKWRRANLAAFILWTPWLIPAMISKLNATTSTGWFFDSDLYGNANILSVIASSLFINNIGGNFVLTLVILAIIAGVVIIALGWRQWPTATQAKMIMLSLWGLLPILTSSLLGVFVPKYTLYVFPSIHLIAGFLISELLQTKRQLILAGVMGIIVLLPSAALIATSPYLSWTEFARYVETRENERSITIMSYPDTLAFNYHYKGHRPVIGIYLGKDNMSYEERIVRSNWNLQLTTEPELTEWLFGHIKGNNADTIYIIQNAQTYAWLHEILFKHGWLLINKERAPGYAHSTLYEFHAPQYNSATSTVSATSTIGN